VLLGNGDGTFRVAPDIVTPLYSKFFALGDFNHDGYADLAVLRTGDLGNYFDLLLNDKQWGTKPRRR
jgi:hypothetical protein